MKKKDFITLVMSTVGGILFALGMCMALVGGFNKISDKFVDEFLTKDGETVEHAKARLAQEQAAREAEKAETQTKL